MKTTRVFQLTALVLVVISVVTVGWWAIDLRGFITERTQDALKTAQGNSQTPAATQSPATSPTPAASPTGAATRTTTPAGGGNGGTYTVKPGDTCFGIAQANNTTVEKLMDANDITDESCPISAGQQLKLP